MNDEVLALLNKIYEEFIQFKNEINEKVNDLSNREENDYRIIEDMVAKIGDLKEIMEKNHSETIAEQKEIIEILSEKIAMLMLRK